MPVFQIKNASEHVKVGIWKITEDENELEKLFSKPFTLNSNNNLRKKQWLATRLLLNEFFDDTDISYDIYGKPQLNNGWHISITHSYEFVAIIINENKPCGIDIEKITPKVERIKHKFLNPIDVNNITSLEDLIIYWSAKEALYKYYGKKEVLFIEHLFIENFTKNNPDFKGKIDLHDFKIEMPMVWEKIEDYMLVYTL